MPKNFREGCFAINGERCWGMTKGKFTGPCSSCLDETAIMNANPYDYGCFGVESVYDSDKVDRYNTSVIELDGLTEAPFYFDGSL